MFRRRFTQMLDTRKRTIRVHFALAIFMLCLAACVSTTRVANAGEIRGRVAIKNSAPSDSKIVSRSLIQRYVTKDLKESGHGGHSEPEKLYVLVYIESVPAAKESGNGQVVILDQTSERFVPHVLPIQVGTTVQFLNSDDVYHNVFSYSPSKSFDLGRYPKGHYRSVVFDQPGVVKIYCDIHTHMNAFILVLQNGYFATTDEDGNFRIPDVPPGSYTLKAWYGRWPEKSVNIMVSEDGITEVDFAFP